MEGKLKTQHNKTTKERKESGQHGIPENVFTTESMGMQAGMQQSMPGASYDSMPTNDPIMLPMTNMAPDLMSGPEFAPQIDFNLDQSFSWEMIGLGLEEPMPTQEAVDELYDFRPPTSRCANQMKEHKSFSRMYIHLYQCSINIDIILLWIWLLTGAHQSA